MISAPVPAGARAAIRAASARAVPTGTVDFPAIRHGPVRCGARASAAA